MFVKQSDTGAGLASGIEVSHRQSSS